METFLGGLALKIVMSVVMWGLVQFTPAAYADPDGPSKNFLIPLVLAMLVMEVAGNVVFISIIAFFSKISDPSIGASYMTLLNTLTNLGSKWITSLSLYLLPQMTWYACKGAVAENPGDVPLFTCSELDTAQCTKHGGTCEIELVNPFILF